MRQLWAPWRMEFIRSMSDDDDCFLCRGARNEPPEDALLVHRGDHVFAILNRYPYSNGHMLIVPYRHVASFDEMGEAELLDTMLTLRDARRTLQAAVNAQGFNVGYNLGHAAGAGLQDHIHMHIVPRWVGDTNFMPVLGEVKVIPQALEELAGLLRERWPPAAERGRG